MDEGKQQPTAQEILAEAKKVPGLDQCGEHLLESATKIVENVQSFMSVGERSQMFQSFLEELSSVSKSKELRRMLESPPAGISSAQFSSFITDFQNIINDLRTNEELRNNLMKLGNFLLNLVQSTDFRSVASSVSSATSVSQQLPDKQHEQAQQQQQPTQQSVYVLEPKDWAAPEGARPKSMERPASVPLSSSEERINKNCSSFLQIVSEICQQESICQSLSNINRFLQTNVFDKSVQGQLSSYLSVLLNQTYRFMSAFGKESEANSVRQQAEQFFKFMQFDSEVQNWLQEFVTTISQYLEQPVEMCKSERTTEHVIQLMKQIDKIMSDKSEQMDNIRDLFSSLKQWYDDMVHDPALITLQQETKKIIQELALNTEGQLVLKPHMLDQLRLMIINLIQKFGISLPFPKLDYSDDTMGYSIWNAKIALKELVPHKISITQTSNVEIPFHGEQDEVTRANMWLKVLISDFSVSVKECFFQYTRKSFPALQDEGKMTMEMKGVSFVAVISLNKTRKDHLFELEDCNCYIDNLSLAFFDTKHDTIYDTLATLFSPTLKSQLKESLENCFADIFDDFNRRLYVMTQSMATSVATNAPIIEQATSGIQHLTFQH